MGISSIEMLQKTTTGLGRCTSVVKRQKTTRNQETPENVMEGCQTTGSTLHEHNSKRPQNNVKEGFRATRNTSHKHNRKRFQNVKESGWPPNSLTESQIPVRTVTCLAIVLLSSAAI